MGLEPPLMQMQQQWLRQEGQQPRPQGVAGTAASRMEEVSPSAWLSGNLFQVRVWGVGVSIRGVMDRLNHRLTLIHTSINRLNRARVLALRRQIMEIMEVGCLFVRPLALHTHGIQRHTFPSTDGETATHTSTHTVLHLLHPPRQQVPRHAGLPLPYRQR